MTQKKSSNKTRRVASAICRVFGCIILIAVIAALVPVTIPRLMGYEIYNVASGSMEPEIPVGSIAYVKEAEPASVEEGEIIAFSAGGSVVIHRVVDNQRVDGTYITKGDANETEDFEEVPYRQLIGRVTGHFPVLGQIMMIISDTVGKILMLCLAACGVLLNVIAGRLREPKAEEDS